MHSDTNAMLARARRPHAAARPCFSPALHVHTCAFNVHSVCTLVHRGCMESGRGLFSQLDSRGAGRGAGAREERVTGVQEPRQRHTSRRGAAWRRSGAARGTRARSSASTPTAHKPFLLGSRRHPLHTELGTGTVHRRRIFRIQNAGRSAMQFSQMPSCLQLVNPSPE